MSEKSNLNSDVSGVLIVNKHAGVTSHDIVNKVRRLYHTKKVGHTGTLDPMATGVLVVLLGRAAKASEYLSGGFKTYKAGLKLGITTDTEDITGNIISECNDIPSEDKVRKVCQSFIGGIQQIPPMYSALKVGGKKLYELAREGKVVDREPRSIKIERLDVDLGESRSEYILTVRCSGGTYIRTLCADIGTKLNCGGAMSTLARTEACGFSVEESYTIDQLEEMSDEKRLALLKPTESLFYDLPKIDLNSFFSRLCYSGCSILQKKLGTEFEDGCRLRIYDQSGRFFALGEVRRSEEGPVIKAIKLFEL